MQQPPGWYPNPADATQLRWWDGNAWTDHTAPLWGQAWQAPPARRRKIWPWIVFPLVGVALLMGVCVAVFAPRVIGQFKHPIDAANIYLADLRDARLSDAYTQLCSSGRTSMTYDEYVQRLQAEEAQGGHLLRFNAHQAHVQA